MPGCVLLNQFKSIHKASHIFRIPQVNNSDYYSDHPNMSHVSSSVNNAASSLADNQIPNVTLESLIPQVNSAAVPGTSKNSRSAKATNQKGRRAKPVASKPAGKKARSMMNQPVVFEEQENQTVDAQRQTPKKKESEGKRIRREEAESSEEPRPIPVDDDIIMVDEVFGQGLDDDEEEEDGLKMVQEFLNRRESQVEKLKTIIRDQCEKIVRSMVENEGLRKELQQTVARCEALEKRLASRTEGSEPEMAKTPIARTSNSLYKKLLSQAGFTMKREASQSEGLPKRNPGNTDN